MNTPDENSPVPPESPSPASEPAFSEGQKLAGVFVLRRELPGAAGEKIWLAHDEILGKDVSLHFIPDVLRNDERSLGELRGEIKRNRQLIHRGILRVYDLIEEPTWAAISMDWLDGESLASRLQKKGGGFSVQEVEPWARQICATLDDVHKIHVVHRNLSPANLFVDQAGKLLIAKFGVSRVIEDALGRLRDRSQGPEAHLAYLSPQQLDGETPTRLDDIYALGSTLFELVSGHPVFAGQEAFSQVRRTPAPAVGHGASPAWEKAIAACLAKTPEDRPASAGAVAQMLELGAAREGGPVAAVPAPAPAPTPAQVTIPAAVLAAAERPPASALPPPGPGTDAPAERTPTTPPPSGEESAREKRKIIAPPVKTGEAEQDATDGGVEEIYPDLYPKKSGGSGLSMVAIGALVVAIVGCVLYFSRQAKTGGESLAPVNREMARTSTPPPATPAPVTTEPKIAVATGPEPLEDAPGTGLLSEPQLKDVPPETPGTPTTVKPLAEVRAKATPGSLGRSNPPTFAPGGTPLATPAPARTPGMEAALPAAGTGPVADLPTSQANLEKAREASAQAEKAYQEATRKQQAAEAAVTATQKTVDDKTKAAAPTLKATDDLQTERQKREQASKAAADAARDARQAAEEQMRAAEQKARQAEDAKKAFTDWEMLNKEKLAGRDKMNAELEALKTAAADKKREAEEAARLASDAEAARQKHAAAIKQATEQVAMAQAAAEQARKAEADKARMALKAETDRELSELKKRMDDLMRKQEALEKGETPGVTAPPPPAATPAPRGQATPSPRAAAATPAPSTPAPVVVTPTATPPPLVAMNSTPTPIVPPAATTEAVPMVSTSNDKVTFENSLGIKFAPVGDVSFAIWPVRIQDYEVFAQEANVRNNLWRTPGFKQGPTHPVVNVSWIDAMAFCKWLTDREHKKNALPKDQAYRLPTDLEWSRAVGLAEESGKTAAERDMGLPDVFPWGNAWPPPPNVGNYTGEETGSDVAIKGYDDGFAWTSPVGSFPPNKYGLYDMGGNVWQWCMDVWEPGSKARVLRGASWYNGALKLSLLSSCRLHSNTDSSTDNYGFRIVRSSEASSRKIR